MYDSTQNAQTAYYQTHLLTPSHRPGHTQIHTKHMNTTKHLLDLRPRPKLRISEVERLIRVHRIIIPTPSRRALIAMCENGTFESAPRTPGGTYLIYEDSFLEWIKSLE